MNEIKIHPYEDLRDVDKLSPVIAAESSLHSGWEYKGFPVVRLNDVPWALKNQDDRSLNLALHCWDLLDSLLKAHSGTGDAKYLRLAVSVALDWIGKNSNQSLEGISQFAWQDLAVGVRSYRLAYLIDACDAAGTLTEKDRATLWKSLEQHQAWLADDAHVAFQSSNGFYQVAGQLAMGRRFAARSPLMAGAKKQGAERLAKMLDAQFGTDGIHREHSPDYHRKTYDTLKVLLDSGLVDDQKTLAFADKIEKALSWFVLPSRHIANFGDSDYRLMSRKPADVLRKWRTPQMQYVTSGGAVGAISVDDHAAFPEGGYFVARKPSKEKPNDFSRYSYLAQIAGFHSRTHKHADDLSFIWSDRGAEILVDAGRYAYLGKAEKDTPLWLDGYWYSDPTRVYCETTRAHNTLEFDNLNYKRKGAKPYGSALKRWAHTDNGVIAVETECKQHGSIRHSRVLMLLPGQWLVVFDWFHDNKDQPHVVKQWFHLAPNIELMMDNLGPLITMPSSKEPLRIVPLLPGTTASRPVIGQKGQAMQGWWSPKEKEIVPSYALCFEQSQVATGTFGTLFTFSSNLTPDLEWSTANVSGRKAQFRWKDENGRHVLFLDRSPDSNLSVRYTHESGKAEKVQGRATAGSLRPSPVAAAPKTGATPTASPARPATGVKTPVV